MTYIPAALRREVAERAHFCCEYCRMRNEDKGSPFAIDHIISEKHGGETVLENLCYACFRCNGYKGSDIASIDPDDPEQLTWLFSPRKHIWTEHFRLDGVRFIPLIKEGWVTVLLLRLNDARIMAERRVLAALGVFPC